jgi:Zn-finger nucleic acid-binding protein
MKCPICNSKTLLSVKYGAKSVYCPECNEVWSTNQSHKNSENVLIFSNHTDYKGYNPKNHIYSRTNNHELMDDKKRNKELLFLIE